MYSEENMQKTCLNNGEIKQRKVIFKINMMMMKDSLFFFPAATPR